MPARLNAPSSRRCGAVSGSGSATGSSSSAAAGLPRLRPRPGAGRSAGKAPGSADPPARTGGRTRTVPRSRGPGGAAPTPRAPGTPPPRRGPPRQRLAIQRRSRGHGAPARAWFAAGWLGAVAVGLLGGPAVAGLDSLRLGVLDLLLTVLFTAVFLTWLIGPIMVPALASLPLALRGSDGTRWNDLGPLCPCSAIGWSFPRSGCSGGRCRRGQPAPGRT